MKETWYFRHDYGSRNDGKLLKLRAKFGNTEGYGLFWMIVEVMAEDEHGSVSCSAYDELSLSFGVPVEKIEAFMSYCVEIGLFIKENDTITSKRMQEHKAWRKERSASGKKGAAAREKKKGKKAKHHAEDDTQDDTQAHQIQDRKEQERTEVPTTDNVSSEKEVSPNDDVSRGADAPRDATHHEEAKEFFANEEVRQQYVDDIVAQSAGQRTREYVADQVQQFFDYWMEQSKTGKPGWTLEKKFQVKRRLVTWFQIADQKAGRGAHGGFIPKHVVISA